MSVVAVACFPARDREDVHLPGVVVQRHAGRGGDRDALFDQAMDQPAEVAELALLGKQRDVRKHRHRGDGVDRRVEDQLRPLGGQQVGHRLGLETA